LELEFGRGLDLTLRISGYCKNVNKDTPSLCKRVANEEGWFELIRAANPLMYKNS